MWRPNFALAVRTPLPHNAIMAETHPFTFRIEADPLRELRYRWTVCEGIAVSREDPKILRVDDAEIVGDGRRELVEPLRHGLAQEAEHGFGEVAEFGVAPVVGDVLVHHLPESLDRVEMRTVGRHEVQDDPPPWLLQPTLDDFGVVVAGVVEENMDAAHRRIGALQRLEQGDRACRVDGLD